MVQLTKQNRFSLLLIVMLIAILLTMWGALARANSPAAPPNQALGGGSNPGVRVLTREALAIWHQGGTSLPAQSGQTAAAPDAGAGGGLHYGGSFRANARDAPAPAWRLAEVLVLDTVTNAPGLTTGSSPRSYMGDPFNAADPGGPMQISTIEFYMVSTVAQTFSNGLCLRIQFWENFDGAVNPVFSTAVSGVRVFTVPGPISLNANAYYIITGTPSTPLTFANLANNGFAINYQGNSGSGCTDTNNLTSLIRCVEEPGEAPIAVGSIPLAAPTLGYYRNASGLTSFNFNSSDLYAVSGTNSNAVAIRLYATLPDLTPTPTSTSTPTSTPSPTPTPTPASALTEFFSYLPVLVKPCPSFRAGTYQGDATFSVPDDRERVTNFALKVDALISGTFTEDELPIVNCGISHTWRLFNNQMWVIMEGVFISETQMEGSYKVWTPIQSETRRWSSSWGNTQSNNLKTEKYSAILLP